MVGWIINTHYFYIRDGVEILSEDELEGLTRQTVLKCLDGEIAIENLVHFEWTFVFMNFLFANIIRDILKQGVVMNIMGELEQEFLREKRIKHFIWLICWKAQVFWMSISAPKKVMLFRQIIDKEK